MEKTRALRAQSNLASFLPFGRALYREQAIAVCRLAAALCFVVIFPLVEPLAGSHQLALSLILFGYAMVSVAILARVFVSRAMTAPFLIFVHSSDLLWPSLICLFTGCARSPFLLLFIFALLATPFRKKWLETLLAAVFSALIVLLECLFAVTPAFAHLQLVRGSIQWGSFAVKVAIFLILGGFLSYSAFWAEREQLAYATRSILRRLRAGSGIQANLREILPAIRDVFEARKVVLVLRNASSWRVFQWGAGADEQRSETPQNIPYAEVDERHFRELPSAVWAMACSRKGAGNSLLALDRQGHRVPADPAALSLNGFAGEPLRSLLITNLQFGSEWSGQLFLVDAPCAAGQEACLHLLHQLADEVGTAAYSFYLWQHTSARVRSIERQHLARDLHDGVVQSLIATEMQLDLLRRQSVQPGALGLSPEVLLGAQNVLRTEVTRLRQQIDQLRSSTVAGPLLPRLAEMIEHFRQETGIATVFSCDVREESVPGRFSAEVLHIVQEALSNIRRHSGARKVEVRLSSHENTWEILVQDDGCGFDFSGRLSLAQLEASQKGPRAIRERVHSANGELTLESYPNRGAVLKIRLASNT
ncbi:MAG TPA: histidine kinase [Acidobacteriaceae bacterium]|nr:histidine kinase [Acidobacteriaceae bacterium]